MSDETTAPKTQVEIDREWRENVYQGDAPQLTARALITGLLLGWLMALSNLYVGLKSGWGLGVDITACVLGFAIWKGIEGARLTKRPFGMLENGILMTSSVAPSYATSAGLVSAIPAMMMLDPTFHLRWWQLGIWISVILFLGLMVSIPIKRQLINAGELKFPAAIPSGTTLKSMYAQGTESIRKATSLGIAGVIGVVTKIFSERSLFGFPALIPFGGKIAGISIGKLTLGFETSWIFIGFGAMIGIRVGVTMLVGILLNYAVLAPWMINEKQIKHGAPNLTVQETLDFPLTIPAGSQLAFAVEEANVKPEIDYGVERTIVSKTWPEETTYNTLDDLVATLSTADETNTLPGLVTVQAATVNIPKIVDGNEVINAKRPIPFIPFEIKHPEMVAVKRMQFTAPHQIYWESQLSVLNDGAVPDGMLNAAGLIGFAKNAGDSYPSNFQAVGGYRNIVSWTMWPGVGMMVLSGLLAFAFQWKTIVNAFSSVFAGRGPKSKANEDPVGDLEIPMSWFMIGFPVFSILAIVVMQWLFHIPVWMGILAVIMSFFLAVVATRASGETGINPIGAMGKVTQLTFGALDPGNIKTNLMTANVTAGAAVSSSDMINMLKVGHMSGMKPRQQFFSQFAGILIAILVVPVFYVLVPNTDAIGTAALPAPAAIVWRGVAQLLSEGISALPKSALLALIIFGVLGLLITTLEKLFPKIRRWWWLPSPAAMGIAMTVPAFYCVSMFLGALGELILSRKASKTNDMYTIPIASGFIAGESLTGVFFALLAALGG